MDGYKANQADKGELDLPRNVKETLELKRAHRGATCKIEEHNVTKMGEKEIKNSPQRQHN